MSTSNIDDDLSCFDDLFRSKYGGEGVTSAEQVEERIEEHNRLTPHKPISVSPTVSVVDASMQFCGGTALDLSAFLNMDIPERSYLLEPWLPEGGLVMVHAAAGVGKTYFALNVAFAVATGTEFLGWKAPTSKSVLYVDGEMGSADLKGRLKKIANGIPYKKFHLITPDRFGRPMPDIAEFQGQHMLSGHIENVDLVVIDNLSCLIQSGDENDVESWRPIQKWLVELKGKGKTVLILHHESKAGSQRGTSARQDSLDTVIRLSRAANADDKSALSFDIEFKKSRGFYGDNARPMNASMRTNRKGEIYWSHQISNK